MSEEFFIIILTSVFEHTIMPIKELIIGIIVMVVIYFFFPTNYEEQYDDEIMNDCK